MRATLETVVMSYSLTAIAALAASVSALTCDTHTMKERLDAQFDIIDQLRRDQKALRLRIHQLELKTEGETA